MRDYKSKDNIPYAYESELGHIKNCTRKNYISVYLASWQLTVIFENANKGL